MLRLDYLRSRYVYTLDIMASDINAHIHTICVLLGVELSSKTKKKRWPKSDEDEELDVDKTLEVRQVGRI